MKEVLTIDLLISIYLSGNATTAQCSELVHWLEASAENRKYFTQQKILWIYSEKLSKVNQKEKFEKLERLLQERQGAVFCSKEGFRLSRKTIFWNFRYAAVIILLIGLTISAYFILKPKKSMVLVKQRELYIPNGSRSVLILPDHSKLWINLCSKLSYNTGFGKNNRDINLVGEAYFDVAKNSKLPFIVHVQGISVKAIGTKFNIKAYPDEKKVETTLVSGLLEIEKAGLKGRIFLKSRQKIVFYNKQTNNDIYRYQDKSLVQQSRQLIKIQRQEVRFEKSIDPDEETAWKDGKLIFDREPLKLLVLELERKYAVHFTFSSEKLKNDLYTGTFKDVSIEQIMEALRFSSPVDYEINGKEILIKEKE